MPDAVVCLVDVDNTLLDNDAVVADLKRELVDAIGPQGDARYWQVFQERWAEVGYADYFGVLQRLHGESPGDQRIARLSRFLVEYPFGRRVYPGALDAIAALGRLGRVVILSDGDAVYQPNKIARSGLAAAVGEAVLIYVHKEEMIDDIERRYPAQRYVIVEDKLRILAAVKAAWRDRVTTIYVRQGSYANDPAVAAAYPAADVTVDRIADLRSYRG